MEENKNTNVETVENLMKSLGVGIIDLPLYKQKMEFARTENLRLEEVCQKARIFISTLYNKFVTEMGEEDAYEWVSEKFSSDWLTEFEISEPTRYKVVEGSVSFKIVVPQEYDEHDFKDIAANCDLYYGGDWSFETGFEGLTKSEAKKEECINDLEDLD